MKIKGLFLAAVLCISGSVFAVLSGSGTEAYPYLIQSRADFDEFANPANAATYWASGVYTALMCDLDLSGTTYTQAVIAPDTDGSQGSFQGTIYNGIFDGNHHTISNLTIAASGKDCIGLFGGAGGGQVKNIGMENVNITGREDIGALIGDSYSTTITACYSTGIINGYDSVGGLVGSVGGSAITFCYSAASVSGMFPGGLVGVNGGVITSCYATGTVSGSWAVGGLVGWNLGTITSSYSTGPVSSNGGGLVKDNGGTVNSCFWDIDTSGRTTSGGGTGKTTAEMKTLSTFTSAGWDFSAIDGDPADWWMPQGGYPLLSWQGIPTTVNVSNVVGMTQANAESAITSAGLTVGTVTTAYSSSVAAGNVISQSPAAGTSVNLNTAVNIQVSLGVGVSSPWQLVSNMQTARDQFTGCVIGDKIYVFGGNGNPDGFNLNSGEVYDIAANSWSPIAANNYNYPYEGIEELSGVGLNGKFYVFGGWGGEGPSGYYGVINFNEMYDPDTDTWSTLTQKPTIRTGSMPAAYNGKIYLFGGDYAYDDNNGNEIFYQAYPDVEAYNTATNTWELKSPMPNLLMNPAVAVYNDSAYLIGGYDPNAGVMNTEVMVYNFTSDTWTRDYCTVPAEAARAYSYASPTPVIDGKVYLIGGAEGTFASSWSSDKFTLFDIEAKTWESGPALPEARCGYLVVMHGETPYVIGGYDDENDLDRAESTVYMLAPMAVDLSGQYWFGSLGADVTTNLPWGKRGTVSISGYNWSQEWDDYDGHHTFSSPFTTTVQPDGSINVNFPAETYNVAWNGDVMIHADTIPDANNRLGIDMMVRKAANVSVDDLLGEYSFFGHWLGWNSRWDEVQWGNLQFDANGGADANYFSTDGYFDTFSGNWTLDDVNGIVYVSGTSEPALMGEGGIVSVFQNVDPDSLGYNLFIKKTNQTITPAEMAGTYQVRFLESGPGSVPYTCGQGTFIMRADGTYSIDAYYSDGEHDTNSGNFTIGSGNTFSIAGIPEQGIISSDKNLIFMPEYTCSDPRNDYDWIGGIFLIRNIEPAPAASGSILWQTVKAPLYGGVIYALHSRITISGMKACSLKGPNMADFEPAVWIPQLSQWSFEKMPFTLPQLQQESLGVWQLKIIDNNDQESIYSFTISGTLLDSEFLPIPFITEPVLFAPNVIAEHYTLRWNSNGAQNGADALIAVIAGNGFYYYSNSLDLSTTEWCPGWLEIGEAYCRVCYADYRPDMMDTPLLVSGPGINWESSMASLVSGPNKPFTVKYSLDFNDDDRIDLTDLVEFCSHWLEIAPSDADFDDGGMVEFEDFAIFAQHWLEDVNDIADHVFGIDISTEWDYSAPNDSLDDEYGFDISFTTDDTVDYIEFTTPVGKTFEIPSTALTEGPFAGGWREIGREFDAESGRYEWCYYQSSNSPSLSDYGDGLYTVTIYFAGGRVQQTTAWFGIPDTNDPIPQPIQEPVFTSFNHGDTVTSPVTFTWQDCNDPAVEHIYLETDDNIPGNPIEKVLLTSAIGLDEPLDLTPGLWDDFELSFGVDYQSQNSDGIPVYTGKSSESDYILTVVNSLYSGGSGTMEDPYQIASEADLLALAAATEDYDKSFILIVNLDLTGVSISPIGNTDNSFVGSFDGSGHILSNMNLTAPDAAYGFGLFGFVGPEGQIHTLGLSNVSVNCSGAASSKVGGLCGINQGLIENCWVTGCVGGSADSIVGGICGENHGGFIKDCFVSGTISGSYAVGGLAGMSRWRNLDVDQWNPGRLQNNFALGSVVGSGNRIGGLVGFNHSTIFYCYADCSVTGYDEVGGLAGYHDISTVLDCYAGGSVSGNQDIGGLIGLAGTDHTPQIWRCYARGSVAGSTDVGGLIGRNIQGQTVKSFWDTEATGQSVSDGGTGKTTLEMQTASTFTDAGWDFYKPVWGIFGLTYPTLTRQDADINNDGQVDMEDLSNISWLWGNPFCGQCGCADLSGDRTVNIDDLNLFAEKWLWQDNVSNHVFRIEINYVWDYDNPDTINDDTYDIEMGVETDESVMGIQFTTPAGNTFEIPHILVVNDGIDLPEGHLYASKIDFDPNQVRFGWEYEFSFFDASSLNAYGDGLYTFTFTYDDGRTDQTQVWFGRENLTDALPQPTQQPVFTSIADGQTLFSPATFSWEACTDIAAERIELDMELGDTGQEQEFQLPIDATGLPGPVDLDPGFWDPELSFEVGYHGYNTDGIEIYCAKGSESDYEITVMPVVTPPADMVWITINDSGDGMKDGSGNPISQGGFVGQMSKYETTNAQYAQYLNAALDSGLITVYNDKVYAANDSDHTQLYFDTVAASDTSQISYSGGIFIVCSRDSYSMANHPVVQLSWYGAMAFANFYGWRLPTEWEWQAAADYDGSYTYGCGTTINQSIANYYNNNTDEYANPIGLTSFPYTSPAGYYPANGYGLCDMAGNVFEWTSTVSGDLRVIRGGCWYHLDVHCTVWLGLSDLPDFTYYGTGFRVCR